MNSRRCDRQSFCHRLDGRRRQHRFGDRRSTPARHLPVCKMLVVEDNYFHATKIKNAFIDVGAMVLGPFANVPLRATLRGELTAELVVRNEGWLVLFPTQRFPCAL
ncbi:hypothetical protein QO004_003779 [Rhizobium mesoamericanum]|uniref:hypothetical protein n=1 Tax=Rhizobium mesoamericanum TaxID=1079800 RepID=UPI00278781A7|nr:hypothetical protein [Rhizobium mesoamericanum]MDQ0561978.1 hypothetical protein [Rhizobium mesoamericanum]